MRHIPPEQRKVILFSNFQNNVAEGDRTTSDGLTRGFPSIIMNDFVNFGAFRVVSAQNRRRALEEIAFQQSGLMPETGIEIGRLAGAELLLTGSFIQTAQIITIEAQVIEISSGETLASGVVSGPIENTLFPPERALIKQLSLQLLTRFDPSISPSERATLVAHMETQNIDAVNRNYHGELLLEEMERMKIRSHIRNEAMDRKKVQEIEGAARRDFEAALAVDPAYEKAKQNLQRLVSLLPPVF